MYNMEININENLISTLERLASERNMTTSEYVEGIMEAHLLSQYKLNLTNTINNQKLEDIASIDSLINTKVEEIRIRDYVEPLAEQIEAFK